MDIETTVEGNLKAPLTSIERSKTPLRMRYTAEVSVIKRQIGDLDEIRLKLGLSRRKICQLLMVDPSAWTRWIKDDSAPPHIYRALEWYVLLTKEAPAQAHSYWISTVQGQMRNIVKREKSEASPDLQKITSDLNRTQKVAKTALLVGAVGWIVAIFVVGLFVFTRIFHNTV